MLKKFLDFVLRQRLLVVTLTLLLVGVGLWSAVRLPIDAVPDITNIQVQINTNASALSSLEVEKQITLPVEVAVSGLPRVQQVRSVSKFGISQVTVVFEDGVDIYFARQLVQQRLQEARAEIPPGFGTPEMGPISTGLGEIYQYTVETTGNDLREARTIQDWVVKPVLRTVAGVAEVNSLGGFEKQYEVLIRPNALLKYGLILRQVQESVAANNQNRGGGYIVKNAEQFAVRGIGQVQSLEQIRNIVITSKNGIPVKIQDVAEVRIGSALRQGAMTKDGKGEVVSGIVMMLMGSNSRTVVESVKARFAEIAKSLPDGVKLKPYYDRAGLVNRTIHTVEKNLFESAILVIAVLLLLLGNLRAAVIVALSIPLSMLFAVTLMEKFGIAGSLMSLGAIDFGLIVDGSVVMVENSVRRLSEGTDQSGFIARVMEACGEVGRPIIFGIGIIIIVYLPILTLEGVEGKLFRPMAITVVFALIGSLLLTFTITPVLTSLLLSGKLSERENFFVRKAKQFYGPALDWSFRHKSLVFLTSGAVVLIAIVTSFFLGSEFIPRLDENAFALEMRRPTGISLEEANRENTAMEQALLRKFPNEIETIVSKTGRAEIATDPMGPNSTDFIILLKPPEQWRSAANRDELLAALEREFGKFLGVTYEFSQPIEMRMNELIAGVRSDLAIQIFGEDMGVLERTADQVVGGVSTIPGARGFRAQQVSGLPMMEVTVRPDQIARYGINAADVMEVVEAIAGLETTVILEGQKRFDLVLRFSEDARNDKDAVANLSVTAPGGERVPLKSLADIREVEGPAEISHLDGSRVIFVEGNVRGRDIGSFVEDTRKLFDDKKIVLPPGYRIRFGGQFENLERARNRLMLVVPLSLLLIFLLLFTTFNSVKQALLVFSGIPLAIVGGVFALLGRGMPFSISAGVGFIALFGVAVLNGVVMVTYINHVRHTGKPLREAIREGALVRLRPVLMTALVASLGFIPMAVSTSAGAEVQRPLATVVIGGLVTSTLLTLLVLPLLYEVFGNNLREEQTEQLAE
jgi:cobalt-zinc-cadmium resistance protein CzcA